MVTALYAGSFDPITYGHIDIVDCAAGIFDNIIIAVANNIRKQTLLDVETRVNLIKECTQNYHNVKVCSFDGLTVDFAKKCNAQVLLRGIRNSSDFEYENELAQVNEKLNKDLKTIFLPARHEHCFISSSAVRELIKFKGDISDFVPECVKNYLLTNY